MPQPKPFDPQPLPCAAFLPPARVGESPFWHPDERALYWCDIPAGRLLRHQPSTGATTHWDFGTDLGCCAPLLGGGLLLALRDGLWRFDPADGARMRLAEAPYDTAQLRFNDGKADPRGRFWVGTLHDRREPVGGLWRFDGGRLECVLDGAITPNGLAWSPDAHTLYWSDTRRHAVHAFDFDAETGGVSNRRVLHAFAPPGAADGEPYGGRPDGAAVDAEGAYWVALFEGARLLRLAPDGTVLREVALPVQCPTMPCFGGDDLKTLYLTTAREGRPADELARQPWAGQVLQLRVEVPGLPVQFVVPPGV